MICIGGVVLKKYINSTIIFIFIVWLAFSVKKYDDEIVLATPETFTYEQVKSACKEKSISFELVWTVFKVFPDVNRQEFIDDFNDYIAENGDVDIDEALMAVLGCSSDEAQTIIVASNGAVY